MAKLFRFDADGLTEPQTDALVGEVLAQGEASDDHPDVEREEVGREELVALVRGAVELASDHGQLGLSDDDFDLIEQEILRALLGEPRVALVGNVVVDEDTFWVMLQERGYSLEDGKSVPPAGELLFEPYLPLFDAGDPDDGPVYLMYGGDGGGTVFAPDCGDVNELERRLIRALGDAGWTLDDHGVADPQTPQDGQSHG